MCGDFTVYPWDYRLAESFNNAASGKQILCCWLPPAKRSCEKWIVFTRVILFGGWGWGWDRCCPEGAMKGASEKEGAPWNGGFHSPPPFLVNKWAVRWFHLRRNSPTVDKTCGTHKIIQNFHKDVLANKKCSIIFLLLFLSPSPVKNTPDW